MNIQNLLRLKRVYSVMPKPIQNIAESWLFKRELKPAMKLFLSEEEYCNSEVRRSIYNDACQCRKLYSIKANEYFLFDFRNKSDEYRSSFIPDHIKDAVLVKLVGWQAFNSELKDKYKFYQLARTWFGREALLIRCNGGNDLQNFKEFASKHPSLFIKSNTLSKGRGTGSYLISSDAEAEDVYVILSKTGGEWIVEEKIVQNSEMGQWNESSVNTVRLPAVLNDGKWTPFAPVMRTGRKGSVVDNAAQGGIITCIDVNDGTLITDGVDEKGHRFVRHPDSNITFKGWKIPYWNDLIKMAEELHRSLPKQKYVGWDFALTNKGWVVIEGNWGQFLSQYNDHVGLKTQFFKLLGI